MYHILCIVYIFIFPINCFNLSYQQQDCNNNYENEIIKTFFANRHCITILLMSENFPSFINFNIPVLVKSVNTSELKPDFNMLTRPRRDFHDKKRNINKLCSENKHGYLIISNTFEELLQYAFCRTVTAFSSPQGTIFIYLTEDNCSKINGSIFDHLWNIYKVPQIVVTGCSCKILFYNPFLNDGDNFGKLRIFTKEDVYHKPSLIVNKLKNFHKYPIKAMVFRSPFSVPKSKKEYVGIDINLLKVIADYSNLTAVVVLPTDEDQYGFKLPNGTYTGALGKLLSGEIDYINVNFFIKDYLTIDIEFSASITADNLCVIMRKAEKIPDWQLLYFCLDKLTWLAIITIYFAVAISWILLQKLLTLFREDAELYPFVFTDTFRLMITSSLFRLPIITSERVFLAMCLMAFVTLVGAFQGSLIGVYSTPMFYKDVDTLEELSQTETQIKSEYMFFINDVFSDLSYPVIAKLKSMISFYNDNVSITHRVANQKNFATLVRKSEVQIDNHTTTYFDSKGMNLIHMVKECPRSYNLAYPFPVNSALLPVLNMIMLRASEAGLLVKWYEEMAFNVSASRRYVASLSDSLKVFSLKDMQISFYQLLIGCAVAFLAFIIEFSLYICSKHEYPEYHKGTNQEI